MKHPGSLLAAAVIALAGAAVPARADHMKVRIHNN